MKPTTITILFHAHFTEGTGHIVTKSYQKGLKDEYFHQEIFQLLLSSILFLIVLLWMLQSSFVTVSLDLMATNLFIWTSKGHHQKWNIW